MPVASRMGGIKVLTAAVLAMAVEAMAFCPPSSSVGGRSCSVVPSTCKQLPAVQVSD